MLTVVLRKDKDSPAISIILTPAKSMMTVMRCDCEGCRTCQDANGMPEHDATKAVSHARSSGSGQRITGYATACALAPKKVSPFHASVFEASNTHADVIVRIVIISGPYIVPATSTPCNTCSARSFPPG